MFNSYEFTFAGESSAMYGLMLYDIDGDGQEDVHFGNVASIKETRINNRIQPIHFGVNYHEEPLSFKLVFGAETPMDRYDLQTIAHWLTGHQQYQWLTIDQPDMEDVYYRCLITELTPISHGWLPIAFEATVTCDCPYAYSSEFSRTYTLSGTSDNKQSISFIDMGNTHEYMKPRLTFQSGTSLTNLKIKNITDNSREFSIEKIPANTTVVIDSNTGVITSSPTSPTAQVDTNSFNPYTGFNYHFLRFVRGNNELEVEGTGALTVTGRYLYNIAG